MKWGPFPAEMGTQKGGEVELGLGEETNLIYFINMMVSLFNLPRQGVFGL